MSLSLDLTLRRRYQYVTLILQPVRRFESEWARTITGIEEGTYGWVALNYKTGALADATELAYSNAVWEGSNIAPHDLKGHEMLTVGTLDLGGSSLEV
jgi:hypothetical protein